MKNEQHDERIQNMLDQGMIQKDTTNDSEVKAYHTLYQALQQEPELSIPLTFSEKVAARALHQQQQKARRQSLLIIGVIIFSVMISLFSLRFAYPPFFAYMLSHKGLVAFTIIMFAAIQLADHWLVRRRWNVRFG